MGPTNVALVKLFEADRKLRDAQSRLDSAAHNVRIQERRVSDLTEKLRTTQHNLKENQAKHANLEMDLKSRDQHIEKLRTQQQGAKNNKEYQALLVEINTRKLDRGKVEEQVLVLIDLIEKQKTEVGNLSTHLDAEKTKLDSMRAEINDRLSQLQSEVNAIRPEREAAEILVPVKIRDLFNRLADRYDGEAMAGIDRPDRRKEEYLCTACNMDLVRDIYNKLNSRDDVVFCPNCQRMLFIPDHFTAEHAIGPASRAKPKTTVKRVKTTTEKAAKAEKAKKEKAATAGTEGVAEFVSETVVLIEARASGELGKALAKAQGESVSRAVKSDTTPVDCEIHVDGKLAGIYKGISVENLERAAKFFLGESKVTYSTIEVKPIAPDVAEPAEAPESASVPESSAAETPAEATASVEETAATAETSEAR
ncbi:zinc ribbon domain-containing protein [Humisphaera borealis]|uniref:C4-type zinc ribbon domain-containing protein n=1 Tax=Humisphaera borealis TaxID=2807512 RepID=A0A7M2WW53_9BACT|nr:C4-type zinc ribbon domain-containing protein [Humisphaera borealis]QOV89696.1 hypothetical protein IPV69_26500 [Humisphaera borealis]